MWKLVFRGKLERDVTHEQAVEGLARLLKKTPEEVEEKLFSGRAVRIATVETEDEAQKYKRAFARAGAFLELYEQEESTEPEPGKASRLMASLGGINRRGWMIGSAVVLVAIGLAVAAWYLKPVWQTGATSTQQRQMAEALATADMVAMGHLDIDRTAELHERLYGESSVEPLPGPANAFWQELQGSGLALSKELDEAFFALYADDEQASHAFVVLGSFEPESIRAWLKQRYMVDRVEGDRVYFSVFDESKCEQGPMQVAYIAAGEVLIAPPARAGELMNRWRASAKAERDLAGWHKRQENLATLAVYQPSAARNALPGGTGLVLSGMAAQAAGVEAFYLALEPVLIPPGIRASAAMAAADPEVLDTSRKKIEAAIAGAREASVKSWPELQPIFERIEVSRSGDEVGVSLRLDADFDEELQGLATSFFSQAFSVSLDSGETGERIQEHPREFSRASAEQLKPYGNWGQGFFEPQWESGPFAAAVSRLAVVPQGGLAMEIRAAGRGMQNLGRESDPVTLKISDVTDQQGNTLLGQPDCGPDTNREPAVLDQQSPGTLFKDGEQISYMSVMGSKTVSLKDGVDPDEVAAITGEVVYRMPVKVDKRRVDAVAGALIEQDGMRLYVEGQGNSVRYQLSGDSEPLLELRALNKEGRYLAFQSSTSSDNWFGPGRSGTLNFHGDLRQIEIVLASEIETLSYPLLLKSAYPPVPDSAAGMPAAAPTGGWRQLDRAMGLDAPEVPFEFNTPEFTVTAGPALIAQHALTASSPFGLNARVDVFVPMEMPVAWNLAGGEIVAESAIMEDGTGRPMSLSAPLHFTPDGGYWLNGEYQTDPEKPWLKASATLSDPDQTFDALKGLAGRLIFRVPIEAKNVYLDLPPGSRWQSDDLELTVSEWREGGLYLDVDGDFSRLVAINPVDAAGESLGGHVRLATEGDSERLWVGLGKQAARLEARLATDMEHREQRFRLTPPESQDAEKLADDDESESVSPPDLLEGDGDAIPVE